METHLLALQAKVLLWVGLGWLGLGLYLGHDPLTVAWRAALGALVAMWVTGKLLRMVARVVEERIAIEAVEAQLAAEKAVKPVAKKPAAR